MTDKRNGEKGKGVLTLDGEWWLLRRVMKERKLRRVFMVRSLIKGKEVWDFDHGKWDVFMRKVKY